MYLLRSGHRVLRLLETTKAWSVHEGRNGNKVSGEHKISQDKSEPFLKPSSHSKGDRCAPAVRGHWGPGGGAGWGGVGVVPLFETLPISGATRQAYASSWPSIGPRQLSLAKRTIPDWPRLRLPPPPPGGGTWERVRGVCALGVCARGVWRVVVALIYFLATAKLGRVPYPATRSRCAETW